MTMHATALDPAVELDIEVRSAVPADAGGIAAVYDRVYAGGYPFRALTDPAGVRGLLEQGGHDWFVAVDGDRVVGTVLARPDPTDGRYECGGAAVDPEYQGRAQFGALLTDVVTAVVRRPDCEVVYCYARSEGVRRAVTWTRAGWRWTGSDGGMHLVGGEREEHVFGLFFNRARPLTRVAPAHPVLVPGSALATEVAALGAATRIGPYPATLTARAAAGGHVHESARGRVRYAVVEASRAVEVDSVEVDTPGDVRGLLREVVDGAAPVPVEHLMINVLADKVAVIADLCRPDPDAPGRRFTAVGYRPAWHRQDGRRYDCVTLATRVDGAVPLSPGLDGQLAAVRAGLDPTRTRLAV